MKYKLFVVSILVILSILVMSVIYKLEELGGLEGFKYNYIMDVSENGYIIGFVNGIYKLFVDVFYIDFDVSNIKNVYDWEKVWFELIDKEIMFMLDDI